MATYPDVRFVWTHRDPAAVLPSVCDLVAIVTGMCTDHLDPLALGHQQVDFYAGAVERGLALRDQLGEDRFVDVHAADLWPIRPRGHRRRALRGRGLQVHRGRRAGGGRLVGREPAGQARRAPPRPHPLRPGADEVRERFAPYLDRLRRRRRMTDRSSG